MAGITGVAAVPFLPYMQSLDIDRHDLVQALGIMFLFIIGALTVALALQGAFDLTNLLGGVAAIAPTFVGVWLGQKARHAALGRDVPPDLPLGMFARRPAHGARPCCRSPAHAPAQPSSHDLRHPRAVAALLRRASATCCRSSTPTSRARPRSTTILEIDHELIRFDDVVAEYPGFEACTPAHIAQVLEFGERAHAGPTAMCWSIAMPASRARPRPRRS